MSLSRQQARERAPLPRLRDGAHLDGDELVELVELVGAIGPVGASCPPAGPLSAPCEATAWLIRAFKGVQLRSASNAFNARIVENDGDCRCRRGRFGN